MVPTGVPSCKIIQQYRSLPGLVRRFLGALVFGVSVTSIIDKNKRVQMK